MQRLVTAAPYLLAAYLLVPTLLKAWLQPYVPVDLTVLLAVPSAAIGLLWVALRWRESRLALLLWAALTALIVVGVVWAPDRSVALPFAARWGALAALPLLAALPVAASPDRVRHFLLVFVGVGVVLVILGLVMMPSVEAGELELLGTNRLGVARVALVAALIALTLAWRTSWSWAAVGLAPLAAFVAIATGSRAAVFGFTALLLALVVATLLRSPRKRRVLRMTAAGVGGMLVLVLALGWMVPEHALARFGLLADAVTQPTPTIEPTPSGPVAERSVEPEEELVEVPGNESVEEESGGESVEEESGGESVAARFELAALALSVFVDSPFIGAGTGGFAATAPAEGLELYPHPHNLPLHFAADFGLFGLALAGVLTLAAAYRLWPLDRPLTVALALLFGFLLLNAMLSNGIYENRLLWGVWLMVLAVPGSLPRLQDSRPDIQQA